jgi:hypothetical protein
MTVFVRNPPPKDLRLRYQQRGGSTPSQVAPDELTCEYSRDDEGCPWICLYCRHTATDNDITAAGVPAARVCAAQSIERENKSTLFKQLDKKQAERERRAAAARARRKLKADQLAAIRNSLRTPVAELLAEAEKKIQEEKLEARMSRRPKIEVSGGGYLEQILTVLGVPKTGRVVPQGVGQRPGQQYYSPDGTRDPWVKSSEEIAVAKPRTPIIDGARFTVKLNGKDERSTPAYQCISDFFIQMLFQRYEIRCTKCGAAQDDDVTVAEEEFTCWQCGTVHGGDEVAFICRFCYDMLSGQDAAASHAERVHGDEALPTHNPRWGNALRRWSRTGKRKRKVTP